MTVYWSRQGAGIATGSDLCNYQIFKSGVLTDAGWCCHDPEFGWSNFIPTVAIAVTAHIGTGFPP